jgi:hypothetical protein
MHLVTSAVAKPMLAGDRLQRFIADPFNRRPEFKASSHESSKVPVSEPLVGSALELIADLLPDLSGSVNAYIR